MHFVKDIENIVGSLFCYWAAMLKVATFMYRKNGFEGIKRQFLTDYMRFIF